MKQLAELFRPSSRRAKNARHDFVIPAQAGIHATRHGGCR